MKKPVIILVAICFSSLSCTNKKIMKANEEASVAVFPKGEKVTNGNFTGTVWLHMLVNTGTTFDINAGNVTFEPGARTNWQYHPGGQVLLVTSGKGRYQEQGKPVREIRREDLIQCAPNTGASPERWRHALRTLHHSMYFLQL